MAAAEFVISDVKYSCDKMNGLTQFHVSRRLAPLLSILPMITKGRKAGDLATPLAPEQIQTVLGEVLRVVGEMRDEDVNYVLEACLSRVQRWDGTGWYDVWNAAGRRPQYDDVNMVVMIMMCFHVIKVSLGPFTLGKNMGLTM